MWHEMRSLPGSVNQTRWVNHSSAGILKIGNKFINPEITAKKC